MTRLYINWLKLSGGQILIVLIWRPRQQAFGQYQRGFLTTTKMIMKCWLLA